MESFGGKRKLEGTGAPPKKAAIAAAASADSSLREVRTPLPKSRCSTKCACCPALLAMPEECTLLALATCTGPNTCAAHQASHEGGAHLCIQDDERGDAQATEYQPVNCVADLEALTGGVHLSGVPFNLTPLPPSQGPLPSRSPVSPPSLSAPQGGFPTDVPQLLAFDHKERCVVDF